MTGLERQHHSFRLPRAVLDRLRRHAAGRQASQTALVQRYIAEGIAMDTHPMVVFRDGPLGRRAMLEGSRLDVTQVVDTVRNEGGSVDAAVAYLALTPAQVRACIRYYADHADELAAYAEHVAEENERRRAAWEREQAVLG